MRTFLRRQVALLLCLLVLIVPIAPGYAAAPLQQVTPEQRARDMLDRMTPEERVGQLFLVTFQGNFADPDTAIYELITRYYIGGVMLSAANDNFSPAPNTISDLRTLIGQLQATRFSISENGQTNPLTDEVRYPVYAPLFIGLTQPGDGAPYDQILSGVTTLPNQLAIGATWNPELARQVGFVAGSELSTLGINLLIGPSLDVSDVVRPSGESDLNVQVFGGDPYWVGLMGKAYIAGIHEGSQNHLAVVATHFPGLGSADRLPENEVATVRKSLDQLRQIELAPFFAVTGLADDESERVDALQISHIRYQGLQGNIRSTTRPISLDQQALNLLMELPTLKAWRETNGLLISDDLGSRAVRRFYDPTEETFNARRLALDAFLAGNDVLYLNNFVADDDPDAFTTIVKTIEFFTQKYSEDPVFAQRVDEAALRVLTLKFRLYGFFTLNLVLPAGDLSAIGDESSRQITAEVAQRSATLISPPLSDLDTILPRGPVGGERIVFFTDTFEAQQCSECPAQPVLPVDALEKAVLSLYGPKGEGFIHQADLTSYSFDHLLSMLNGRDEDGLIEDHILRADWLVFTMLNPDSQRPASTALQRFLAERPDLIREKTLIVFASNAPYYLDATDISKLTAYFGLYGKTPDFQNVAARLLFKEIAAPEGDLPVSLPGIGYDLIAATSPNPALTIPLQVEFLNLNREAPILQVTPEPNYRVGERITVKAGVILDHNNHPVPDDTPVLFLITIDGQEAPPLAATTENGVASIDYEFATPGTILIEAVSGGARSEPLALEISPAETTPITPPVTTPTPIPSITSLPSATPLPQIEPLPVTEDFSSKVNIGLLDWLLSMGFILLISWGASRTGALMSQVRRGVRWGLSAFIAGASFYSLGVIAIQNNSWQPENRWELLLLSGAGALLGWGAGSIRILQEKRDSPQSPD